MKNVFELKPIVVAGAIGAALFLVVINFLGDEYPQPSFMSTVATGFFVGAAIQVGVRAAGVS